MAKYTIELRKVCEIYGRDTIKQWFMDYKLEDFLLPSQIDVLTNTTIFSKERLADKIIDFYFMREIGFETPALFKHYAKVTMKEIMESKLPLLYTVALDYDPLVNVDFTETFNRSSEGSASNTGNSNSISNNNASGLNVSSDTPQGQINKQDILNGNYASSTSANETSSTINDNTSSKSDTINQNQEYYTRHLKGNQGISATYQAMIQQFRDNIVNVETDIIYALNSLFMAIY